VWILRDHRRENLLEKLTNDISQKVSGKEAFGFNVKINLGDSGMIYIAGTRSPIEVSNADDEAETTFVMTTDDLTAMLSGDLSPMNAYMQGKLSVQGDLGKAMQIGNLFS
jgi:putative sterol carrier protein